MSAFSEMTYLGIEQTPVAEVTIDGLKATGTWSKVTNVLDKTTFTASGNFTGQIKDKETGMKSRDITRALVSAFNPMTYTGAAQTPSATVSVDGVAGGGGVAGTWSPVTKVSDTTTFIPTSPNFIGTIAGKDPGMKQLPVEIEWEGTEGLVYDGAEKEITARLVNKAADDTVNLTVEGNKQTGRGSHTARVTSVDNPNYTLADGKNVIKEWVIAEAQNVFTTGPAIAGWVYGSTPNTPTATAQFGEPTFAYSHEKDGTYTADVPTEAGSYWLKASVAGSEHYAELVSDPVQFQIAQKDIAEAKVTLGQSLTYNGQSQVQSLAKVEVGDKELKQGDYEVSGNTATNVKTDGNYTLTLTGQGNYTGTKRVQWNVAPATPRENLAKKTTARVQRGSTLAQASVTYGELLGVDGTAALRGSFAWANANKTMNADGTERMTFTPTDTNYVPVAVNVAVSTYELPNPSSPKDPVNPTSDPSSNNSGSNNSGSNNSGSNNSGSNSSSGNTSTTPTSGSSSNNSGSNNSGSNNSASNHSAPSSSADNTFAYLSDVMANPQADNARASESSASANGAAATRETSSRNASSAQDARDSKNATNTARGAQDNASTASDTDTDLANQDAFPWWALIVGLVVIVGGGSIAGFAFWKKRAAKR